MKSPFPGMDPFLEKHWGDVHHRLVQYACDTLQPNLPADLRARVEERVFVEREPGRVRPVIPDVSISEMHEPSPPFASVGEVGVAEPLIFEVSDSLVTEGFLEIREKGGGKLITVIEFLSPSNKCGGAGQEKYLEKQAEVLRTDASLVEIDLVRAGQRVLALPVDQIPSAHRWDYLACISPGWKRKSRELYPMPLRDRLPGLPVPLRQHEPRVKLDLQSLRDRVYAAGRYDDLDYASELQPSFRPEDAAWAAELLKKS
ncbi:MAG: DUF4058 family protein [Verrucomicrobia bacterium]|nr:DUF4058 family protein [Verrucomicrobiota bacterium]